MAIVPSRSGKTPQGPSRPSGAGRSSGAGANHPVPQSPQRQVEATVEEKGHADEALRPHRLGDYIGQTDLKQVLHIALEAARCRQEPLDHLLLYGPPRLGKTTTAINLAASLAVNENPSLVVDMDPQANCTSGLGFDSRRVSLSSYEVLIAGTPVEEAIRKTEIAGLDLLPSHINLVGAEIEMIDARGRERLLARALATVRKKYDFILIDCPPSLGLLTSNALTAADFVLIPVQAEYFALEGLAQLMNTIRLVRKRLNPDLEIEGVFITLFDTRLQLSKHVAVEVRRYFGKQVFKTIGQRNVRVAEAPSFGKPVLLYNAACVGARNYLALAKEVLLKNQQFLDPPTNIKRLSSIKGSAHPTSIRTSSTARKTNP